MRRWLVAIGVAFVAVYAPHSWVLWIDYPWGSYRLSWVYLWPVLPGLMPASLLTHGDTNRLLLAILITAAILGVTTWLNRQGLWWCIATTVVVSMLLIVEAIGTYNAFMM